MIDFIISLIIMGVIQTNLLLDVREEVRQVHKTVKSKKTMDDTVIDPNHYEDKN